MYFDTMGYYVFLTLMYRDWEDFVDFKSPKSLLTETVSLHQVAQVSIDSLDIAQLAITRRCGRYEFQRRKIYGVSSMRYVTRAVN